jgi:hypothetical protein
MSAHQETVIQWLNDNWWWLLLWAWALGGFEEATRWWRRVQRRHRNALAEKRQHELNLAKAQAYGQRMAQPYVEPKPRLPLPAPDTRVGPGPCPHTRLVPVVNRDGDVLRFTCGNPLCDAVFPPDTVIYDPDA